MFTTDNKCCNRIKEQPKRSNGKVLITMAAISRVDANIVIGM